MSTVLQNSLSAACHIGRDTKHRKLEDDWEEKKQTQCLKEKFLLTAPQTQ